MITIEELRKLAALSKLHIDDTELASLASELSDLVHFADTISQLEVENTDELTGFTLDSLREDAVRPSEPVNHILKNAAQSDNGFFVAEVRKHG